MSTPDTLPLLARLKKCTPAEFAEVRMRYGVALEYLHLNVPQVMQAIELLRHAEQHKQLAELKAALDAVNPPPSPSTEQSAPRWRWTSSVASAENLEFSVLAAVESLFAVSLSLFIAWYWQIYTHLVVAVVLAPLLLLRTEASTEMGLRWFGSFWKRFNGSFWLWSSVSLIISAGYLWFVLPLMVWLMTIVFLLPFLVFAWLDNTYNTLDKLGKYSMKVLVGILVIVIGVLEVKGIIAIVGGIIIGIGTIVGIVVGGSFICKFSATTFHFFRHPLIALSSIPNNWYRIVWATDIFHPPELLPGMESKRYQAFTNKVPGLKFGHWIGRVLDESDILLKLFSACLTPFFFLPALLYRFSLKSSALFYLPFIWMIGTSKHIQYQQQHFKESLALIKHSALAKIQRGYAWVVILLFTALPLSLQAVDFIPPPRRRGLGGGEQQQPSLMYF